MKKTTITIFCCCLSLLMAAQHLTPQEYIEKFKDLAISEQKRLGIPAAITLAQGLLETENGNSQLVRKSNNHFGIKCKSNWTGETVSHDDDAAGECFRKYNTAEDSYRDHSEFLKNSSRYSALFSLSPTDYRGWAYGLRKAGYATNPRYPEILIKHIETYNLQQFDEQSYASNTVEFDNGKVVTPGNTVKTLTIAPAPAPVNAIPVVDAGNNSMVNGLKAMFAGKGTSLLAIATAHKINLKKLLEYNDLEKDGLLNEEQFVYLEKKQKQGKADYFTATATISMYDISQSLGIQLEELIKYNATDRKKIVGKGSKIALKPGLQASILQPSSTVTHIVEPKEGLYAIAKRYNLTVEELKNINNFVSDDLRVGQQILISK